MNYILEPATFYVGDKVKLFYPLPKEHKYKNMSFNVEKIEQNEDMVINDISLTSINGSDYLLITFTPWQTGNIEFPTLENIGLYVDVPTISVLSIIGTHNQLSQTLQEPRPPILLDGTVYLLYKYIISSVAIFLFLFFLITKFKKKKKTFFNFIIRQSAILLFYIKLYSLKRKLKKEEKMNKNDKTLQVKNEWIKSYEYYLRSFIFSINNIKDKSLFESLTYKEILSFIVASKKNLSIHEAISSLFQKLYFIRFSNFDTYNLLQEKTLIEDSFELLRLYRKEK